MSDRYHVRWLIGRDMPEVMAIEFASHSNPLREEAILGHLRQRNTIGMVAEHGDTVVGYMIYQLHKQHIEVIRLATCPLHRRRKVGTRLFVKLIGKLSGNRTRILMNVHENLIGGHFFLKSHGATAIGVNRESEDDGSDSYRFEFGVHLPAEVTT